MLCCNPPRTEAWRLCSLPGAKDSCKIEADQLQLHFLLVVLLQGRSVRPNPGKWTSSLGLVVLVLARSCLQAAENLGSLRKEAQK